MNRPPLHRLRRAPHARTLQRGVIGILAAITLPLAILATVLALDTGRLYMAQRELQKIADTAAMEAISRLPSASCAAEGSRPRDYAQANADAYGVDGADVAVVCVGLGTDPKTGVRAPDNAIPAAERRAVQVTVTRSVPTSLILRAGSLFGVGGEELTLGAQAIAEKDLVEPWAAFSVGAQLLSLGNDKLLDTVLSAVGVDTDLTVLSSAGLAAAKVTPAGLLRALGVTASIDELKALSPEDLVALVGEVGLLGIDELIKLGAKVVGDDTLGASLGLLGDAVAANAVLGPATLQLFGTPDSPGLIRLGTGRPDDPLGSALDARINLGEMLSTGILAGAGGRALAIPNTSLLGLATLSLGVVEPPTIAVGPVGTQAYNAQVRLHVDVDSSGAVLVGPLLNLLGTRIRLPITIDLTDARGTLTAIDCAATPPTATVEAESRIGSVCVGTLPPAALWSTGGSCTDQVEETTLVNLLGGTLLHGKIALPALAETDSTAPLSPGDVELTGVNTLDIGSLVDDLGDELSALLSSTDTGGGAKQPFTVAQATAIADSILALPELAPSASGKYTLGRLYDIQDKLEALGLNWDRPALLFTGKMALEWRSKTEQTALTNGCYITLTSYYDAACARTKLIESLQTSADVGLLGAIVNALLGPLLSQVGGPLLAIVLDALMSALEPLLNTVGNALTTLLSDLLGLDLGRTEVQMRDIGCGMPRLVG